MENPEAKTPTIDIREQPSLDIGRLLDLSIRGIRYRLFRSFMTFVVISVAIAFLVNMLASSVITRAIHMDSAARFDELMRADRWVARLTSPTTVEQQLVEIGSHPLEHQWVREAAGFSGISKGAFTIYAHHAREAVEYLRFFSGLSYGDRRLMVGRAEGVAIFDHLQNRAAWDTFQHRVRQRKSTHLVHSLDAFQHFVSRWPQTLHTTRGIVDNRNRAVGQVKQRMENGSPMEQLKAIGSELILVIRQAGFVLEDSEVPGISRQAAISTTASQVERVMLTVEMRQAFAARFDIDPKTVVSAWGWSKLRRPHAVGWFIEEAHKRGVPGAVWSIDEVVVAASTKRELASLSRAGKAGRDIGDGILGLGKRMTLLILVSLLVCVVGITNAMVMSVTERYREIATLKCLGALDGSILIIFVLEATILGLAGGITGTVLGLCIACGRMGAAYGSLMATSMPWADILAAALAAMVLGALLSGMASVYPSLKAARLAPMKAMRIE